MLVGHQSCSRVHSCYEATSGDGGGGGGNSSGIGGSGPNMCNVWSNELNTYSGGTERTVFYLSRK